MRTSGVEHFLDIYSQQGFVMFFKLKLGEKTTNHQLILIMLSFQISYRNIVFIENLGCKLYLKTLPSLFKSYVFSVILFSNFLQKYCIYRESWL